MTNVYEKTGSTEFLTVSKSLMMHEVQYTVNRADDEDKFSKMTSRPTSK